MSDIPSSSKGSNTMEPKPTMEPEAFDQGEESDPVDENEICIRTLLKLLSDPYKLCHFLELTNGSEKAKFPKEQQANPLEVTPPELVVSLKRALSNPNVLSRAVRHFQTFIDDDLYKLMSVFQTNCRDLDIILNAFLAATTCSTKDSLDKLIKFLSELLVETFPKRFRLDKMLSLTSENLDAIQSAVAKKRKLPDGKKVEEPDYDEDDWMELVNRSMHANRYFRIFDNSNITLTEALKKMAHEYKGRSVVTNIKVAEHPDEHRMSDSKFHRAYTVADAPNYEKIYNFLSNITGCRRILPRDVERADATVILNIFQELEEVIATHFDTFSRQMPILREQLKDSDLLPVTGFRQEDVNDVESNVLQLPNDFKNMYRLEQLRREHYAATAAARFQSASKNLSQPAELTSLSSLQAEASASAKLEKNGKSSKNISFKSNQPSAKKVKLNE